MVTAAQRAFKAEAKRVQAIGAAGVGDDGLQALDLRALRTEAKRLLGVDYDHAWDHDKPALIEHITQARAERHEQEIQARAERRRELKAALRELGEDEDVEVGEPT